MPFNDHAEADVQRNGRVVVGDENYFTGMARVLNALGERKRDGGRFDPHGIWDGGRQLSDGRFIWFPNMVPGGDARYINQFQNGEMKIDELCIRGEPPADWAETRIGDERIVFAKVKINGGRCAYKFCGIFKLTENEGKHLVWDRSATEAPIVRRYI